MILEVGSPLWKLVAEEYLRKNREWHVAHALEGAGREVSNPYERYEFVK